MSGKGSVYSQRIQLALALASCVEDAVWIPSQTITLAALLPPTNSIVSTVLPAKSHKEQRAKSGNHISSEGSFHNGCQTLAETGSFSGRILTARRCPGAFTTQLV